MNLLVGSVAELGLDSELVQDFYREHWPRKIALSDKTFYDWQFKSVPSAPGTDNCVVAYDASNAQVAGVMGLNPRRFSFCGSMKKGAELTTWIVSDRYRNVGAGARILPHIQKTYDVLIGMGISALALPIYMRSGFRFLHAIPRFVKVLNFDAVAKVSRYDPLAKKLAQSWRNREARETYQVSPGTSELDDTFYEKARMYLNLFTRDAEHLSWRYVRHPFFDYRLFRVSSSSERGGAVICLREETSVEGLRLLHVLDCFGNEEALPAAFSFIEDLCLENGFDAADFYCTSSRINRFPLAGGWFSMVDDTCLQFPHLFHPVEMRTPPTTSLVYWSRDNFSDFCNLSTLYVTKQDADLDRPILESDTTMSYRNLKS